MFLIMVLLKAELAKVEMEGLKFAATASLSKLKLVLLPEVYCSKLGLVFKKNSSEISSSPLANSFLEQVFLDV